MDFDQRLERAIERGQRKRSAEDRERAERAMTEDEISALHQHLNSLGTPKSNASPGTEPDVIG